MNDFEWTEGITPLSIDSQQASNKQFKYNPMLTDKVWDEVMCLVTKIWESPKTIGSDDQYGYITEKLGEINSLPKTWESLIHMIRMFHTNIQRRIIFRYLSDETMEQIKMEMYDRGWSTKDFI